MIEKSRESIHLRQWSEGDLPLLHQLLGDSAMTEHLGGPETAEQIVLRHGRYLALTDPTEGQMFVILADGEPVGSIGYWEKEEQAQTVYETGWSVVPAYQGRGIATRAIAAMLGLLRPHAKYRYLYAYPS